MKPILSIFRNYEGGKKTSSVEKGSLVLLVCGVFVVLFQVTFCFKDFFFPIERCLHSEKMLNRKNSSLSAKIFLSKLIDWKINWSAVCIRADLSVLSVKLNHLPSGKHRGNNLTKLLTKWLSQLHCWGQEPGFCEVLSSPKISREPSLQSEPKHLFRHWVSAGPEASVSAGDTWQSVVEDIWTLQLSIFSFLLLKKTKKTQTFQSHLLLSLLLYVSLLPVRWECFFWLKKQKNPKPCAWSQGKALMLIKQNPTWPSAWPLLALHPLPIASQPYLHLAPSFSSLSLVVSISCSSDMSPGDKLLCYFQPQEHH